MIRKFWASLRLPGRGLTSNAEYGRDLANKANQFGRGEPNFNAMSVWLVLLPMSLGVLAYIPSSVKYADTYAVEEGVSAMQLRVEYVSYLFGWGSTMCLAFFLIPVTRHGVLLAAMGWSPIHALRIHIWFGYLAFVFMLVHGIMLVPVWFIFYDYPVWQQIVPNRKCWSFTWNEETVNEIQPQCAHVFYNWTGIVAAVFFIVLWGSSLNWVRRRNYRIFYILHVTFGTLTLLGIILHMHWFIIYFLPSITYYLVSTTPTLVQALASRFRGGVKIRQVVQVENSGGCVEVQLEVNKAASAVLDREPCHFIKICVPKISLVWHPFDVYKSGAQSDEAAETVRFLFRPVGPFTKQLAERLTSVDEPPVTLVDGLYQGADKSELALQHDCVTIVAGGVAISPYLTLIPALMKRVIVKQGSGYKTKTIVLHWVVRERGLYTFVVNNYLNPMIKRARALKVDVKLAIHVYVTGEKNADVDSSAMDTVEGSSRMISFNSRSEIEEDVDTESAGSNPKEAVPNNGQDGNVVISHVDSTGHPIELPRVMARRFSSPIWNIPLFVAYTGATFLGFWYLFEQDPHDPTNYYQLAMSTWIILYAVLMYVAFGIVVEAAVLVLRPYWPQPKADEFDVSFWKLETTDEEYSEVALSGDKEEGEGDGTSKSSAVTIEYHDGRPTASQIFKEARHSVEPGIFMCGPATLTGMVKAEASKENSYFGLTRFSLYDEPYEM